MEEKNNNRRKQHMVGYLSSHGTRKAAVRPDMLVNKCRISETRDTSEIIIHPWYQHKFLTIDLV